MNDTQALIREHLGDELFYEFQLKFGGINIYIARPDRETVWFYYKEKGMKERDIAMKLRVSEAFVYACIKKIRKQRVEQREQPDHTLFNQ